MDITYSSPDLAWVILLWIAGLAVTWLIIYSAVRVAVGPLIRQVRDPVWAVATEWVADGIQMTLRNEGAPAFDVEVRESAFSPSEPDAQSLFVGRGGTLTWRRTAPPEGAAPVWAEVRWRSSPGYTSVKTTRVPGAVPPREA